MAEFDKVHQLLDQIAEERARGRMQRRALTAAILAIFLFFIGNLYFKVKGFDAETFMVKLQAQATATVWPVYSAQLKQLADEAMPALSDAIAAEASEVLPRVSSKLKEEGDLFQANMGGHMKTALDQKFAAAIAANQEALKARYPQFAADQAAYDQLMERMQASARIWAQSQLDTTFAQHIALLQSINESVQKLQLQAAEERVKTGDRSMEDVLFMMGEIFNARVAGEG